jgi:glycosyltransferase involved in cell wall biosynthesis
MPGFVRNPYPFLKRAGLLVLASRLEGMGLVLIEAMALGIPVVATDCESGPAEVLDRGRYGLLVPSGDGDALADGIRRLLGDAALRASLVASARERIHAYAAERVIPRWQELLQSLAPR